MNEPVTFAGRLLVANARSGIYGDYIVDSRVALHQITELVADAETQAACQSAELREKWVPWIAELADLQQDPLTSVRRYAAQACAFDWKGLAQALAAPVEKVVDGEH